MRQIFSIIILLLTTQIISADDADSLFDKNTAFYEGTTYNYIIAPPKGYQMNSDESSDDGYSFAFIPIGEKYNDASVIIGINIFKIKDNAFTLEMLIKDDTTAIRKHFGKEIEISEVEPIQTATTDKLRTIYFNSKSGIIPNVMMSYFDGKSEILIFDLTITDKIPRFQAETIYLECIQKIKILTKGSINVG